MLVVMAEEASENYNGCWTNWSSSVLLLVRPQMQMELAQSQWSHQRYYVAQVPIL